MSRGALSGIPRAPLLAAGLACALFAATRFCVVAVGEAGGQPTVLWMWPPLWQTACLGLAAGLAVWPGWWAGRMWLCLRGLSWPESGPRAARAWWPATALALVPAVELCAPLYGHTLAPLALGREAWPLALAAALAAVAVQTALAAPPAAEDAARRRPWLAPLVFLLALALFAGVGWRLGEASREVGRFMGGDEPQYLFNAHTLAVDHDLDLADNILLRENFHFLNPGKVIGGHGRWNSRREYVSKHRPGLPLIMAPFYAWGLHAGLGVRKLCVLAVWLLAAWMAMEVFRLGRDLTGREGPGLLAAAGAAAAMPGLIYSNLVFPEMAAAAFSTGAFGLILRWRPGRWGAALAAGLITAYLGWFHERFILLAAILGLMFLARLVRERAWRDLGSLAGFLLPSLVSAGLLMRYFYLQYGRPLPTASVHAQGSYLNPRGAWEGLSGLWVDGAEGLLPYGAIWLAAAAGLVWLVRRRPAEGAWAAAMALATILTAGLYADWFGGINPPARYLVAAVPFLALGLAAGAAWAPPRFLVFLAPLALASAGAAWLVLQAPSAVYGHRVVLDAFHQFPLVGNLLPDYLLQHKTPAVNAALAAVWCGLGLTAVLAMQLGGRSFAPRRCLAGLLAAMLLVLAAGATADGLGPGISADPGPDQVIAAWRRAAARGRGGPRLVLGPGTAPPEVYLDLPPVRYRHPPAKPVPEGGGAIAAPAGIKPALIVWGQYLDLPPGRYRLTARLATPYRGQEPVAWLDAAHDLGRRVPARLEVSGRDAQAAVRLEFSLSEPAAKLECRLGTTGLAPLTVLSMRLARLP